MKNIDLIKTKSKRNISNPSNRRHNNGPQEVEVKFQQCLKKGWSAEVVTMPYKDDSETARISTNDHHVVVESMCVGTGEGEGRGRQVGKIESELTQRKTKNERDELVRKEHKRNKTATCMTKDPPGNKLISPHPSLNRPENDGQVGKSKGSAI